MVSTSSGYDFAAVVDEFLARRAFDGRHRDLIQSTIRSRALALLARPDVRYMPAFKILDITAALVNIGAAIAEATQLRPAEVEALLRESLSDESPLVRQFTLDAALERARYEPMMLGVHPLDTGTERDLILQRRWAAMRAVHHERVRLPAVWVDAVDAAVERALMAEEFQRFRPGPLLQLFAEMLAMARHHHQEGRPIAVLRSALAEDGALWRRYALKTARYGVRSAMPDLHRSPLTPPTMH